ncbi:hypothetical protein AB0C13_36915 [Streptomyces sp. NPDC049099]|uniref:hypothetical protein n=1 Tax=Streptomyces sp. NPDC049099 TaxID=3155768 RepID=UPI00343784CC
MSTPFPADLGPRKALARYRRAMLDKSADDLADLYAVDAVHELSGQQPGSLNA